VDRSPINPTDCCPLGSLLCGKGTGCLIDYFDAVGPVNKTTPGKVRVGCRRHREVNSHWQMYKALAYA